MDVFRNLQPRFFLLAAILLCCSSCEELPALADQQVDQRWLLEQIKSLNEHVEQLATIVLAQQKEIDKLKSEDVYIDSITKDLKNGNTKGN